jgi:hypothetical protein
VRKSSWGRLAVLGCLAVAACVERPVITSADAVSLIGSGGRLLTCRERCLSEWTRVAPQAAQLDAARRWTELAVLVLQAGYEDDLSLYYLGRAAEGLHYPGAAASYYRQSTRLSGTSASCQNLSRVCGVVVLPRAALLREAAISRELNQVRYRPVRPEPPKASRPDGTVNETEPRNAASVPIDGPEVPIPPPPAPSPAPARGPSDSEYIEPPPAPR